ncbi:hypothetical protein [Faecalibaculum rodentium]|uniref:hypothetical protein n=1 Tax=Faecalibaculum rodentium TaxID=1702221 RepID=UPI0027304DDC|nr:hypothetical protein [Faecalibaculum rodentium]
MAGRTDLVEGMQNILGKQWFIYGGYESRPEHLPYGNYGENPGETYWADDKRYIEIEKYVVRLVTDHKDFVLEDTIEALFESLEIGFAKITDEYVKTEKVYCQEWVVVMLG